MSSYIFCSNANVNVIFDIGGVLIQHRTSPLSVLKKIGFCGMLAYLLKFNFLRSLRSRLFETLNQLDSVVKNDFGATDDKGKLLPGILCDWMTGHKTSAQVGKQLYTFIKNNNKFFHNNAEKNVIAKIGKMLADPKEMIESTFPLKAGLDFARECKRRGYRLFILSNWDKETFQLAQEKYPEIFELFDEQHMVISGNVGFAKPHPEIYQYMLAKHNLDPKTCIFFDDQLVNTKRAEEFGIASITCKKFTYQQMLEGLDSFVQKPGLTSSTELLSEI